MLKHCAQQKINIPKEEIHTRTQKNPSYIMVATKRRTHRRLTLTNNGQSRNVNHQLVNVCVCFQFVLFLLVCLFVSELVAALVATVSSSCSMCANPFAHDDDGSGKTQ